MAQGLKPQRRIEDWIPKSCQVQSSGSTSNRETRCLCLSPVKCCDAEKEEEQKKPRIISESENERERETRLCMTLSRQDAKDKMGRGARRTEEVRTERSREKDGKAEGVC